MKPFLERLKSRKFLVALIAAIAAFIKAYYPDFPDYALNTIRDVCLGYVAIEGAIDAIGVLTKWLASKTKKNGEGETTES